MYLYYIFLLYYIYIPDALYNLKVRIIMHSILKYSIPISNSAHQTSQRS